MYQKFFIGFIVAAFVCGIMFCFGGVAEAGVIGSAPAAIAPAIKPLVHFAMWVITAIAIFL